MAKKMAKKSDANQPEIVQALRDLGCSVQDLHAVGQGCPDILVGWYGNNYLFEIKGKTGKLTEAEAKFFAGWKGTVCLIRSVEDAIRHMIE